MFGRERMLCFVYGRRKMVLISRSREKPLGRLDAVEEAVDLAAQCFRLRGQPRGGTENIRRGLAASACRCGDADDMRGYFLGAGGSLQDVAGDLRTPTLTSSRVPANCAPDI